MGAAGWGRWIIALAQFAHDHPWAEENDPPRRHRWPFELLERLPAIRATAIAEPERRVALDLLAAAYAAYLVEPLAEQFAVRVAEVEAALRKHFGNRLPETIIEPGRGMVGDAGVIKAEVVLISKKEADDKLRWVYLDIGKFGGLAETMDESIRYAIRTTHDGADMAPCVLAGPTCDSAGVMYEKADYQLPLALEIGDKLEIRATGAYTTTYSSVAFNGFPPLETHVI